MFLPIEQSPSLGLMNLDSLSFYLPKEEMHLDGKNTDFSTLPYHCWGFLTIIWTDHILISVLHYSLSYMQCFHLMGQY